MSWFKYFFSFRGRISRSSYWLFVAFSVGAAIVEAFFIGMTFGGTTFGGLNSVTDTLPMVPIVLILLWIISGFAIVTKRLHDRGKSAWWLMPFFVVPSVLGRVAQAAQVQAGYTTLVLITALITVPLSLWALVELGILRGTVGDNRFGSDPLSSTGRVDLLGAEKLPFSVLPAAVNSSAPAHSNNWNPIASRPLWLRIAYVGSGVWIGGTILYSLADDDFRFWDDYQGPQSALWFAFIGAISVFSVCSSIPWIMSAARPRPFWRRIGIVVSGIWIAATMLYSLVGSNLQFPPDNTLWFVLIGAIFLFAVCSSIPWIITGAHKDQHG